MRIRSVVLTIAAVCVVAIAAGAIVKQRVEAAAAQDERDCERQHQIDVTTVRTVREWTTADIPGVGDYVEAHWQAETRGNPCGRAPGPIEWQYEGVLRLRDTDTGRFAAWPAAAAVPPIRDTLRPFVPAGVWWRHDDKFPQRVNGRNVDLYVDPDLAVAWFSLTD